MDKSFTLVGSFNLADGYLGAAKALRKLGHNVDFIPAHKYKSENPKEHIKMIIDDIKKFNSDVVLWWRGETVSPNEMAVIRKQVNGLFIMFSWDDPHQWEGGYFVAGKMKHIDIAFSCCLDSLNFYKNNGCKKSVYCLPGFDPGIHYPEESEEHKCDISIVCTNLYHGDSITKYPHISRRKLLLDIINMFPDKDIRIYGSENFKEIFGERYKGWISFNESRKVFYNSKINIDTHVRPDGNGYLNERVGQIMGSGGLLFVDGVYGIKDIFKINEECIVFDGESIGGLRNQISDILNSTEKYDKIRKNGYKKAIRNLTWDRWANTISREIK